jgi:hypothetical protein
MKQSTRFHGGVRGADSPKRSSQFEGRFGRMFRSLPAAEFDEADLVLLAAKDAMLSPPEVNAAGQPVATPENEIDSEENFDIPAGYTYLGQFIDHDITFDPMSSLDRLNDPEALTDFRTPRLDLDCLYGRGPDDQPYMFDFADKTRAARFALGRTLTFNGAPSSARDLLRLNDRAVIGDKRNDENVIVSQLQSAMLRFHNRIVDLMPAGTPFEKVQQQVRWHYQYVVINDFLPRICGADVVKAVLPHFRSGQNIFERPPRLAFYRWRNEAFIPIEFAAAAYRYGHSMVRPIYRLNQALDMGGPAVGEDPSLQGRHLIFAGVSSRALNGFKSFPAEWAIDWSLFFGDTDKVHKGKARVQPSYKIDASLVNPLGFLPEFSNVDGVPPPDRITASNLQAPALPGATNNLALRNLRRGAMMGLPSGQDVARAMGLPPLTPDRILIGKAAFDGAELQARPIAEVAPKLAQSTPLWAYVLAEATVQWRDNTKRRGLTGDAANLIGTQLGPVGARIVAETLIGLLLADSHSFLAQDPNWLPWAGAADPHGDADYTMPKLLSAAGAM